MIKRPAERCHWGTAVPLVLLLLLPYLGEDESQDQHPEDDGQHTQGQRQTQRPVDRVLTGFAPVAKLTVTHQISAAARRYHAGTVVIAVSLSTGGQAVVDASWEGRRDRGGHGRGGVGRKGGNTGLLRGGRNKQKERGEERDEWKEATP